MPECPWRKLYPFPSHFAEIGGRQYHYVDEGAGDVLLMVHGNPTWSFYYRELIKAFCDRYRCIAVDHIGCGLSDKPQDYRYCLDQHTANLVSLIERLDLRNITLLGHDWGGAIGLGAATRTVSRFGRVVLFNTGAFPPARVPRRIAVCRTPLLGTVGLRGLNLFSRAALKMATEQPGGLAADVESGLLAPYDSWANRIAVARFVQDIPLSPAHPTYAILEQLERDLQRLQAMPIQLIWGMRDWCFDPDCLQRFEAIFPDARVHRIATAGHWVIEDAREEVIEVLSHFLNATAPINSVP